MSNLNERSTSWPIVPLISEITLLSGGTPSMAEARYWNGDIPWVSSGEMTQRRIYDTELKVTEDGANDGSKRIPSRTVLVVVRGMSLAKEFRVAITGREVTFNQDLKALLPSKKIIPEFLFYYLISQNQPIRDSASESAHGTKKLDTQVLEEWPLPLPLRKTQTKIAAILGAYDELIENNKGRIALLEKLTEEIYREWFVRFRFPGHNNVKTLKGFPASWTIERVKDTIVRRKFGRIYREAELFSEGTVVVIDQSRSDSLGFYEGEPQHVASPDAPILLFGDHTCKMVFMTTPFSLAENVIPFVPKAGVSPYFLFHLLKDLAKATEYKRHWTDLTTREVLVPDGYLQSEFENTVRQFHQQICFLRQAIRTAEKIRDSLLPRLISGKLSVENLDVQSPPGLTEELDQDSDLTHHA
jgi:type I restriction enzyme S subunit